LLVLIRGRFHFEAIECAPLSSDAYLRKARPDLGVEAVLVHAEEVRRVP
jgi:hypothetical protein